MRRVESSIGTASPSPTPATAVLIPTTRPRPSASAPPEFPGFRAASVWIDVLDDAPGRQRERAAERADDSRGDRAREPHRVADRDDELSDAKACRLAELRRYEPASLEPEHGKVRELILPDHVERDLAPVDEGR